MKDVWIGVIIMVGIIFVFSLGANYWEKSQKRKACEVFSVASGRETKFVEYTFWRRDCLTPDSNGTWISTFFLREITGSINKK